MVGNGAQTFVVLVQIINHAVKLNGGRVAIDRQDLSGSTC